MLLQRRDRAPERLLRCVGLRCRECLRGKYMPEVAAEVADLRQVNLSQSAAALGAGEPSEPALILAQVPSVAGLDHLHLSPLPRLVQRRIAPKRRTNLHRISDLLSQLAYRNGTRSRRCGQRRSGHAVELRLGWILDQHLTAGLSNNGRPDRAIVEGTREYDGNRASGRPFGDASEHHIDSRGVPVDLRTRTQPGAAIASDEVPTGRSNVDPAMLEHLTVPDMRCLQGPRPRQDLRQSALFADVDGDEDNRGQIARQAANDLDERLDAACGSTHGKD